MKKYCKLLILPAILIVFFKPLIAEEVWKLVKSNSGIKIFTRPSVGSSIDEFKGITIINAPIMAVFNVLSDIPSHTKWRTNCLASRIIKKLDDFNLIVYTASRAPWPVSNRDAIIKTSTELNSKNSKIIIRIKALKNNLVPVPKGFVRMTDIKGIWILEKRTNDKTMVIYSIRQNPSGMLPAVLANMASREMPYKTLNGLRQMVKKMLNQQR